MTKSVGDLVFYKNLRETICPQKRQKAVVLRRLTKSKSLKNIFNFMYYFPGQNSAKVYKTKHSNMNEMV